MYIPSYKCNGQGYKNASTYLMIHSVWQHVPRVPEVRINLVPEEIRNTLLGMC